MESERQVQSVSNGLFLAISGLAVLVAKGILLNPVSRVILAVVAAVWGIYLLVTRRNSSTSGWTSLAASAVLLLLGGLISGITTVIGVILIVAGGASFFGGLLGRGN